VPSFVGRGRGAAETKAKRLEAWEEATADAVAGDAAACAKHGGQLDDYKFGRRRYRAVIQRCTQEPVLAIVDAESGAGGAASATQLRRGPSRKARPAGTATAAAHVGESRRRAAPATAQSPRPSRRKRSLPPANPACAAERPVRGAAAAEKARKAALEAERESIAFAAAGGGGKLHESNTDWYSRARRGTPQHCLTNMTEDVIEQLTAAEGAKDIHATAASLGEQAASAPSDGMAPPHGSKWAKRVGKPYNAVCGGTFVPMELVSVRYFRSYKEMLS
jgi:hypothetical protein